MIRVSDTSYPVDTGKTPNVIAITETPGMQYWETIKRNAPEGHVLEYFTLAEIDAAYDSCWE